MRASILGWGFIGLALIAAGSQPAVAQYRLAHIAGGSQTGFAGDGGPATAALLDHPAALALATDGSLLIADTGNHRIRRISTNGLIDTVAGNGGAGSSGDGGLATEAELQQPRDVAIDAAGNLFIVDGDPARVRRVDVSTGRIETLLGASLGSYTLTNDPGGNVYIAITTAPWQAPAYLLTRQLEEHLAITPLVVRRPGDSRPGAVYALTARDPSHLFFGYQDYDDYGIARGNGALVLHYTGYPGELYALSLPWDISIGSSGRLYFTGQPYYGQGRQYILRAARNGFGSVAGGGSETPVDGALADRVALAPSAIAVANNHLIFVVHGAAQVFALQRALPQIGSVAGSLVGLPSWVLPNWVSVFLIGDDGSYRYATPDSRGHFRFPQLPPGTYRVVARFYEEGQSCDASNCGWSGAYTDCPAELHDPVVTVTTAAPRHRVQLRLFQTTPCV